MYYDFRDAGLGKGKYITMASFYGVVPNLKNLCAAARARKERGKTSVAELLPV